MNVTIGVEKTRELRRAYYAAVSFVDNELGRVISEVKMLVIMMLTVVVMIVVVLLMNVNFEPIIRGLKSDISKKR